MLVNQLGNNKKINYEKNCIFTFKSFQIEMFKLKRINL